jgi:flagellar hook-associated protein 1 FlgK
LSGLRATQTGLSLIASNVANAQTPGYVRKTLSLETRIAGGIGSSVNVGSVNREIDQYIQRQLRVETSGGSYAALTADFYQRLQKIYGAPGSDSALESIYNKFIGAIQDLTTNPETTAARSAVISSAQVLAQHLNSMTEDIQAMRGDAESGIADAVTKANDALLKIAALNSQLATSDPSSPATAAWEDQRDLYVNQLSELMDLRVVVGEHNQYNIFTTSGVQLVGTKASQLSFNPQATVTPATQWNADPAQSTLGTLLLVAPGGGSIDLIANSSVRSGKIAAYIEMRDKVLVEAQNQLDSMAAAMSQALSDVTTDGTAVTAGAQSGFELDVNGLLAGNTVRFTYTDYQTGLQHNITLMRVDDLGALPLSDSVTIDPNDKVIGINFAAGLAAVVAQLNATFNNKVQFSNPAGTTLRLLDDGAANLSDIDAASVTRTVTALSGGGLELPFFTDGTAPYSGAITTKPAQLLGFAGRIAVNPLLAGDPAKLVLYSGSTAAGDAARPNFIYERLVNTALSFAPNTGLGTAATPYVSDLPTYLQQVLSFQGNAAENAISLSEGQSVVVNNLQQRLTDQAGVNVDREMANLVTLQTAYGANARVMTAIRDMIDILLKMV